MRYGDAYGIGDDLYRRDHAADVLRIAAPAVVGLVSVVLLVLSLLTPHGLRDQCRRERQERRQAKDWSRRKTSR